MPFASSEHLVPVGSIHGIQIDGDAMVSAIRFGHPLAIEQYNQCPRQLPQSKLGSNQENCVTSIVECRMATDENLQAAYRRDSTIDPRKLGNEFSHSTFELFTPVEERGKVEENVFGWPELQRATSYQLVFDVDESDPEEIELPVPLSQDRRAISQFNLNYATPLKHFEIEDENTQVEMNPEKTAEQKRNVSRTKRVSSSLARKPAVTADTVQRRTAAHGTLPRKVISRPALNPLLTGQIKKPLVSRPPMAASLNTQKEISRSSRQLPFVTEGTQVGTEVRPKRIYRPTLPYEVEQLEQLSDEESVVSVPSYRILFRSKNQTTPIGEYPPRPNSLWNGSRNVQLENYTPVIRGSDPRRATIAGAIKRNSNTPTPIRSPLTILDQQWDQILPVIPTVVPDILAPVNQSGVSADNTISSNSEENHPPYVHWFTQMKQKSRPVSMAICDDPGPIGPEHDRTRLTSPSSPQSVSPIMNGTGAHVENGAVTNGCNPTNGSHVPDRSESDKSKQENQLPCTNGILNGQLNGTQEEDENVDEPLLLIDCIPMDENVCVVQQPIEAWPVKSIPPEVAQVVQPWNNRLSLRMEAQTFSHPTDDAPDPEDNGDNTESLLSGMTMRSEYGNYSMAFDEGADVPGHSIHDPRYPDSQISEEPSKLLSQSKEINGIIGSILPPQTINSKRISQLNSNGVDKSEPPAVLRVSQTTDEPRRPEPSTIIMKRSSTNQSKLPTRTPSDLRRVVLEKQMVSEIPEAPINNVVGRETENGTLASSSVQPPSSPEKSSNVSKLFRGLQGRRSFLNGKLTPKPARKADANEQNSSHEMKSKVNGHNSSPTVTSPISNGHTPTNGEKPEAASSKAMHNDNIRQFVQSPKKWFSRKLTGVKM
ncbi:unnamed protein product [Echinostoma caproni]|uniref:BRCT domain-containing protein n=1 Tax=Echinostoma caproni TaxID=27848 RepID=A0A183AG16_9TREM|nr:unnamed protein product [Echinostoma caproni]